MKLKTERLLVDFFSSDYYKEYYDGFRYYFSKADEKRVTQLNRPFRVISPEEQMIVIRLRKPKKHEPFQLMSSEMINLFLNYGRHNNHFSNRKIGEIMTELDFECIHKRTGNYFKVVEIPLDHQQVYIASEDFDFEFEEADDDEAAEYQQLGLPLWTEVWFSELVICNFSIQKI